ncbi:MAG: DUF1998 domain-containing protein [Nitrococcus mobilis]|nr:DUF1998 domain-containing protein [Nitrococcus mobilis]
MINSSVLTRQLLIAYCFDRWSATGIDESAIPAQLRKVLDAVEHQHQDRFPYNLIGYVSANKNGLLADFFGLFDHLDEEAKTYLSRFLHEQGEGSLSWRLLDRLQLLVKERRSLLQKAQQLKLERERLRKQPEDDATRAYIEEVERERGAVMSLLYSRNTQSVLNFLTDEGLLPNYAFPEEGVTLQSVILRRRSTEQRQTGDSAFEKAPYVFQRPAQAALGELAPESCFYAVSHQMEIDQVDLQLSETEVWRFCDRCQHTERVDLADRHSACPRCGSPQWADSGQRHTVLKLRQVYSTVDDRINRIGDDAEQREPQFFNRQMLVDIGKGGNQGGFRLKSDVLPSGFEFLRRATFREVNFGAAGGELHIFSVAGRELSRRGFRICRHCGKVQKERLRRNEHPHAYTCMLRRNPEQTTAEDYFDSLYLYRELSSEAIRILLPLSEVAYSDEKLHSFVAALNLGLRRYFRGNVHHVEVTDMREPAAAESGERIYLVIYDRIPGGTGYLKDLMRTPDNLMRVLEAAYQRLSSCECIDDEHLDGCYRCILAYRDSRNMPTISRKGAAELLAEILALRDRLEPVETLSNISTNVLIESKLEQRFVDALAQLPGAQLTKAMVNGKTGSLLTLPGADGQPMPWLVEHQRQVGPIDDVPVQTAIDVLLTPARAKDAAQYRPIAVYLDGLQYHHDIVADDVSKRSALLLSGRYWVYSLNWDDLPEPGNLAKPHVCDLMRMDGSAQQEMNRLFDGMANQASWLSSPEHKAVHGRGSLEWLACLLREPEQANAAFLQRTVFRGLTALAPQAVRDPALRQKIGYELTENAPLHVRDALCLDVTDQLPGGFMDALGNSTQGVEMAVALSVSAMQNGKANAIAAALRIHLCFDDRRSDLTDDFKDHWRAFWHAANQLQFLPGFSMATRSAVTSGLLDQLWSAWQTLPQSAPAEWEASGSSVEAAWPDVFALSSLARTQIRALIELDLPEPEVGVDLATEEGEVIVGGDVVELCWPDHGVAVVNETPTRVLEGWHLVPADEAMVSRVKELVEQGVF